MQCCRQVRAAGYNGVVVTNREGNWKNGMGKESWGRSGGRVHHNGRVVQPGSAAGGEVTQNHTTVTRRETKRNPTPYFSPRLRAVEWHTKNRLNYTNGITRITVRTRGRSARGGTTLPQVVCRQVWYMPLRALQWQVRVLQAATFAGATARVRVCAGAARRKRRSSGAHWRATVGGSV